MFVCAAKCDISWVDNRPFTINTKTIIMSSMFMKVFRMLGPDTEYLMLMMILSGCQHLDVSTWMMMILVDVSQHLPTNV